MVDAWTKQVIENGPRNYVALYNIVFTGTTGISAYVAADPTSSGDMGVAPQGITLYPGTHLKIRRIEYDVVAALPVQLLWDATTAQLAWTLTGFGHHDFKKDGMLYVPQSAGAPITGATGKILFTTPGTVVAGNAATIKLWLRKDIAQ